jgi:hypothetical protein
VTSSPPPKESAPTALPDLTGVIGRAVLETLLPARRPRYSARNVKCPTSRYHARLDGPALPAAITTLGIAITTPPLDLRPGRTRRDRTTPRPPQPPTRRQRVTAIMNTDPGRDWPGSELARQLQVKPRKMLTQLAEWARLGFLTRTGQGTYALNTPTAETSSTSAPAP